jgi:hypothetical protein
MLVKKQRKRRIFYILHRLKSKKGEGYIDMVVLTIVTIGAFIAYIVPLFSGLNTLG